MLVAFLRETFNAGTISKLEVDKNGTFVTVYTRNLTTDAETGGYITGDDNRGRVSDTLIPVAHWLSVGVAFVILNAGGFSPNPYQVSGVGVGVGAGLSLIR
jgi:hypothetical protein